MTVLVTDAGDPVVGSSVTVGGHLLHTAADGSADIELPSGSYDVTATKPRYVSASTHLRDRATLP